MNELRLNLQEIPEGAERALRVAVETAARLLEADSEWYGEASWPMPDYSFVLEKTTVKTTVVVQIIRTLDRYGVKLANIKEDGTMVWRVNFIDI